MMFQLIEVLIASLPQQKATSSNSHLPPSQDPHRPKKQAGRSNKRPGGQPGHKGSSLSLDPNPDKIIKHPAKTCDHCSRDLSSMKVQNISRHQVIDIEFTKVVTEHQVEHKLCPCGHHQCHSAGGAPVSYGSGLKAAATELNQLQCVPFKRCAEFFAQKFALSLSPATLVSFAREASERLRIWEESVKDELLAEPVLHADETGINVDAKTWWVHVLCSEKTTLMVPHQKRGVEGMIETEVLPHYHGILCHDFLSSYSGFDVVHAPCHAHLQRELKRVSEDHQQDWAGELARLLARANEERSASEGGLSYRRTQFYEGEYSRLLSLGKRKNPAIRERTGSRGRIGQSGMLGCSRSSRRCRGILRPKKVPGTTVGSALKS